MLSPAQVPGLPGFDPLHGDRARGEGEEGTVGGGSKGSFNTAGKGEKDGKGKERGIGIRGSVNLGGLMSGGGGGGEGRETILGTGAQSVDLGSLVDSVVVESGHKDINTPTHNPITLLTPLAHPTHQ